MGAIQQSVNQLAGTIARTSMYKQGIKAVEKTGKQTAALTNTLNRLPDSFYTPMHKTFTSDISFRDPEVANRIARAEASMAKAIKPINIYKELREMELNDKH